MRLLDSIMGRPIGRPIICAIGMLAVLSSEASAQIRGTVRSAQAALPAATVELWTATTRIASAVTDQAGAFSFSDEQIAGASLLVVQHIGYRTEFRRVSNLASPVVIDLEIQPPLLPDVVVEATTLCPGREEPAARAAWRAMQSRYQQVATGLFIGTGFYVDESIVPAEQLGRFGTRGQGNHSMVHEKGSQSPFRVSIERDGYARRIQPGMFPSRSEESWQYAKLGSTEAGHFIEDAFGKAHVLRLLEGPVGTIRIAFCPRDTKRPRIEGTLTIRPDSSLSEAQWRFRVNEKDEGAGGNAVFPPLAPERTFLHPVSSTFWRRDRFASHYYQRLERYSLWRVGTHDDVHAVVAEWHRTPESKR